MTITADITRWYPDDRVTASGNVQVSYKDYKIVAESVEADLQTNDAVFRGPVKLSTNEYAVEGERLTLDLKTKEWTLDNASSTLSPVALQSGSSQAFVRGETLKGREGDLWLSDGTLTTCSLEDPHYVFEARELEIHPNSRVVARKVSIIGLGRRVFTLPSLVIPVKGLRHNLIPQVGQSAEEGVFLKAAYAYSATADSQGFLKLDLMQKRGIGVGVEHTYKPAAGSGQLSVYYLRDQEIGSNNVTGQLRHQQRLGSIDADLTANYRTNNYLYYPTTTAQNWRLSLSHGTQRTNTALAFYGDSNRGFGTFKRLNSSLRHAQQFTGKLTGMLSMDARAYEASSYPAVDQELESVLELRQREEKYDLSLTASRRTDLDGDRYAGDDFYSALDRLPEITFETDSYRLGDRHILGLPYRLSLSAGRYYELPAGVNNDRLLLELDMLGKTFDIGGRNELNVRGGFRQALYAKDMAQQVLRLGGILTTRYGDYLKTRLTYDYQRPEGYSPFLFDYTGRYNYLRALVDYQDSGRLRWSLSTGYDLDRDQHPWQDLALRLTAHPNPSFGFSVSTGYDLNRSEWRNLITRFQVNVPERIGMEVGARYDVEQGKLDLARGRLDVHIGKKWRLEGITSWNGMMKRLDYKSFRLTRDLHCWEASLSYNDETGFRRDKGLSLDLRIKAFPRDDRFGIGQYGQAVDTSMGEYY